MPFDPEKVEKLGRGMATDPSVSLSLLVLVTVGLFIYGVGRNQLFPAMNDLVMNLTGGAISATGPGKVTY